MNQNWAQFFSDMNANPGDLVANANSQVRSNSQPVGIDLSTNPAGETADLHYQSIGKRSLAEGDSLSLAVSHGQTGYSRIVDWTIPDFRYQSGGMAQEREPDIAWDSISFKNPLTYAMTTGSAMVLEAGRFAGQQQSDWVNAGESTTLHITKALSLTTRVEEYEKADARTKVMVNGREYSRVALGGEIAMTNRRAKDITLLIHYHITGTMVSVEGDPKVSLGDKGMFGLNQGINLTWEFPLKAGQGRVIKYEFDVVTP